MSTIIGLAFGNTTSSIAYIKEGKVEVIANADGDRAIPSMLSYAHGDEFHGIQAKQQLIRNAQNTVGYFRDFLATPFEEINAKPAQRMAQPIKGSDGFAAFNINDEQLSIAEIVRRNLQRLGDAAKDYIGKDVDGCVLALPSDATDAQRQILKEISAAAGLPVVQVIGELDAALLAHLTREPALGDKTYVVADFGGTRSDAAVISVNSGVYTVLETHTDRSLGGLLLDEAVLTYLAKEFEAQYKVNPLSEPRAVAKLVAEAEAIRKTLSNSTSTQYGIDSVASGYDFSGSINRLKYEVVARSVFTKFNEFVGELLKKAKLDSLDIDEVLLVGGVSWTPKVASTLRLLFDDKTKITAPSTDPKAQDPDELIARGCAIQGSLVAGLDSDELDQIEHHLVAPHLSKTVGVVLGESVIPVLGKHTLVPTKKTVQVEGSGSGVKIVELESEIHTTVHKPDPKAAKDEAADEESDWSESEDEEYEVRSAVPKITQVLAEVDVPVSGSAKVTLYVTSDQKLQVTIVGEQTVQGTL